VFLEQINLHNTKLTLVSNNSKLILGEKMKKIVLSTIFVAVSATYLSAASFAACATCHGANAEKAALGKSAIIKGWDEAKTIASLNGYKAGTLNVYGMGAVMKGQTAKLNDADIADLAKQIAAMK
jgi:cytochrome c